MALYSAWDWDRNAYRIYQTRQLVSVGDDPQAPRPNHHPLGAVPDVDVKALPPGARFLGFSHQARGEIVRLPRTGLGAASDFIEPLQDIAGRVAVITVIALGIGLFIGYGQRKKG